MNFAALFCSNNLLLCSVTKSGGNLKFIDTSPKIGSIESHSYTLDIVHNSSSFTCITISSAKYNFPNAKVARSNLSYHPCALTSFSCATFAGSVPISFPGSIPFLNFELGSNAIPHFSKHVPLRSLILRILMRA